MADEMTGRERLIAARPAQFLNAYTEGKIMYETARE